MIFLYYTLACLAHVIAFPIIILLSFKVKYQQSLKARFLFPKNHSKEYYDFWLHACSLGEVNSLAPIVDSIPKCKYIFLSVITYTGFAQAHKLFGTRENITIDYLPFESFLPFVAPRCKRLFVFEAELWLMLFYCAKTRNAHTKLINARISSRSFKRYLRFKGFYRHLFSYIDSILCQSVRDLARLERLHAKNISVIGNIKILTPIKPTKLYAKPQRLVVLAASTHAKEEEIILEAFKKFSMQYHKLAAQDSQTHTFKNFTPHNPYNHTAMQDSFPYSCGEEKTQEDSCSKEEYKERVLESSALESSPDSQTNHHTELMRSSYNPLLIIAPRHPERFELVYNLCLKEFKTIKWSSLLNAHPDSIQSSQNHSTCNHTIQDVGEKGIPQIPYLDNMASSVLVIDTLGELINLYAISDIVILGGSFESIGGHNPLEPATFHNILISGKEIFNQQALFACIQNYYLVNANDIQNILLEYKSLHKSCINTKITKNILQAIFA
ncbi:3-deoxy-D-manno-octulosonic acid transferase [Helicobacter sp. MIT 14-3879]|uniref:3-deoxy-D-manno-octulosonic acid transferase n=1 Tax=Helicobacter sp. MIT 14-3879 TaxID=2040649 RepID=UPI000E1E8B1B|nr:3-deoxy-D-manno-octulosonic acid transferase [Helicobacter sp. MIT 14-3879]RDU61519.1 3-deoxy-D-manno-octulosonic acid transferase [Helicobacter sp. MIT 14-3879]